MTWLLLAIAYLAGAMAWSSRAAVPVSRRRPDALDTDTDATDDPAALDLPLFGRDRLWRLALDTLIGAAVAFAALRLAPVATAVPVTWHGYLAALAAILGHVAPPWHPRRGGSGAPVLLGALAVLWPWAIPAVLAGGLALMLATGYLPLALAAGATTLPLQAALTDAATPRTTFAWLACALVVLRLLPALQRMARGTEARFSRLRLLVRLRRP